MNGTALLSLLGEAGCNERTGIATVGYSEEVQDAIVPCDCAESRAGDIEIAIEQHERMPEPKFNFLKGRCHDDL